VVVIFDKPTPGAVQTFFASSKEAEARGKKSQSHGDRNKPSRPPHKSFAQASPTGVEQKARTRHPNKGNYKKPKAVFGKPDGKYRE
jgi:hypothetical protein